MNNDLENPDSSTSGRFLETIRPLRDLESNWTVDLAKNLEEYLLKICSGQISGDDGTIFSVNFAEAALLLQGSVQVYSRKVEYLYSLVLHALNFLSKKSQEEQEATTSPQADGSGARAAQAEEDDPFWGLDDIYVEAKNTLDSGNNRAGLPSHHVKPPANLVVLEGECLDAGGDAGELESYLLATTDLYRDFILLDPCDAVSVDNFLESKSGKGPTNAFRGSDLASKGRRSFQSPCRQSAQKSSVQKKQDTNKSPFVHQGFDVHSPTVHNFQADENDDFGMGDGNSDGGDLDDSDDANDPWEPLNPHEAGNLKVKPYKKVKANKKVEFNSRRSVSLADEFPLAKLRGPISTELTEIWKTKFGVQENHGKSDSLYAKLRQSLVEGETKTKDTFSFPENNAEDNGYDSGDPDVGSPDFVMPENTFNGDEPFDPEKHEEPDAHENLEDLCRSHLDALLATLAENEKQTEMATRVSTWKQRIEKNLEEQDARPPFDIHKYGERVLDKLSTEDGEKNSLSFVDVVKGQEKHDVARTFSALLQLVNNGDVDLMKNNSDNTLSCHSRTNPFYVRLLKNERKKGIHLQSSKKRAKSPVPKGYPKSKNGQGKENNYPITNSSPQGSLSSCRFSVSIGKVSRGTPEGKKRRKSRPTVAAVDMHFVG